MSDTAPAKISVRQVELIGRGSLLAIAVAAIELDGVELVIQGVTVRRRPDGGYSVDGPVWRHPVNGRWLPALPLPFELADAVAETVLAGLGEALEPVRASGSPPPAATPSGAAGDPARPDDRGGGFPMRA